MLDMSGRKLGQYELLEEIGHGGMATVYRAVQTAIGREVAIKVLPSYYLQERTFLERFTREVQVIAQLQHRSILPVYDFGEQDNVPYIVMALMSGGSVSGLIREGRVPLERTVQLVTQIADALDHAHSKGILHRDFKPGNVLLDDYGNAYLADFGIAKIADDTVQLTGTGSLMGTPAYMAPEMYTKGALTPTIDIYALGITLFQMLTRTLPFDADTPVQYMRAHLDHPVPDVRKLRPELPEGVQLTIETALAKKPKDRYQSAGAMEQTLRAAAGGPASAPAVQAEPILASAQTDSAEPTPAFVLTADDSSASSAPPKRGINLLLVGAGLLAMLLVVVAVVIVIVLAFGSRASGATGQNASEDDAGQAIAAEFAGELPPIKIGYMGPLTGVAASIGHEQLGSTKIALDIFNEETGLNVELVEGDTTIAPEEGILVAESFIADDDIYAVIGPASSEVCSTTQPFFEDASLVQLTPSCTRPNLTDSGFPTFFRPIPHDGTQPSTLANFMVSELGVASAYLVDDETTYSTDLTDGMLISLGALGVDDIRRASIAQHDADFASLASELVAANPDVVFFAGLITDQLSELVVQLRELGYEGIYFVGDGGYDIRWVQSAGPAAKGSYTSFFAPDPYYVDEAAVFVERYQAEYGQIGIFGAPAALAARIALEAIQRCITANVITRDCVVAETATTDMPASVLGIPVSFGPGNQLIAGDFFIFEVQGADFVMIR